MIKEAEKNLIGSAFHILQGEIFINARNKGFYGDPNQELDLTKVNKGERIALMHSELSEALEGVRKDLKDEHLPQFTSETVELADCVIRILDHCEAFGLSLIDAILAKHDFNTTREYMHGKKF